jgi:hypothetical protein
MAFFDETPEGKYEEFFQIFKIIPLCVVLNHNWPGPKRPKAAWKRVKTLSRLL